MRVNSYTTGEQVGSAVATDDDGDFVVTWWSFGQDGNGHGIYAQRYNAAGSPQGSEFRVNSYTKNTQNDPSIGMDADGDFVITWESFGQDGDDYGIYAQRYNAAGTALGSEFRVSSSTTNQQFSPSIGMDADGDFVITWASAQYESTSGIYAQRYNAAGTPLGSEFLVNSYTTHNHYQVKPSIGMDADGDFVVTWSSYGQDVSGFGIYAQRYNAAGAALGSEFRVNSSTTSDQLISSIGMDADGDFVVSWENFGEDVDGYDIYAQRYNAAGTPQGSEFRVNSYTSYYQVNSSIGMDADGDFVVTWESYGQDGSNYGIYAKRYNAAGAVLGIEFRVNSNTFSYQLRPSIGMDADGDFVIAWESYGQDGDLGGVYTQRYRAPHPDQLAAWRSSKFYLDSNHSHSWNDPAADTLNSFGAATDKPLAGDWNADGYSDIGVWRDGNFYLDANGNGTWDGPAIDKQFVFGNSTDTPLVGDWNADGQDDIGVWRSGKFYLDLDGNRLWNSAIDKAFTFGSATDTPISGDWNADGKDDLGIWRAGKFYLDLNANRVWNSGVDGIFTFGLNTDTPLIGDWNADGQDDLGVWRGGKFYQDTNGNRAWNSATDTVTTFGSSTDTPLIGFWRPKTIPGNPPLAPAPLPSLSDDPTANSGTGSNNSTGTQGISSPTSRPPSANTLAVPSRKKRISGEQELVDQLFAESLSVV